MTPDGSLWTMQEPFGAFTWYPVNDHPSDKALYDIAITVPEGWAGIAGGTPAGQTANTFKYTTADPMASYLATLAVGKYKKETAIGPHGLPLTYWYRPGIDDSMMPTIRKTPQYLEWLEFRFGPYPFPTAGVVIVPSKSAMETQQLITMGNFKMERASDLEDVLVHEYAHQWFGDAVGPNNWNDLLPSARNRARVMIRASLGRGRPASGIGFTAPRALLPATSCVPSGAHSNAVTPSAIVVRTAGSPPSSGST
jgi:aminopeptidase N